MVTDRVEALRRKSIATRRLNRIIEIAHGKERVERQTG